MKKQYKYALAGLSFAASTATSIYFGVKGFVPSEAPFQNTAYQHKNPGSEFIRGNSKDPEWSGKYKSFSTELRSEENIKTAFGESVLEEYSDLVKGYKKENSDSELKIKQFLYQWCQKNRSSNNEDIFHLIKTWCVIDRSS